MKKQIFRAVRWFETRHQLRLEEEAELLRIPKKRLLAMPKRYWFNPATWGRRVPLPPRKKVSTINQLLHKATRLMYGNWRAIAGTTTIYGLGLFVFVRSFDLSNLSIVDSELAEGGWTSRLLNRGVVLLQGASLDVSAASGAYQLIIATVAALTLIYVFRKTLSHTIVRTKQALYTAPRPLVPYLLVLAWMGLLLTPVTLSFYLFSLLIELYLNGWQTAIIVCVLLLISVWTLRKIVHTIFALFVVTLPDMTPMKAIKSAKKMVFRRRLMLWRKIIGGILVMFFISIVLLAPFLVWLPGLVPVIFFILTCIGFTYGQAYLFVLYREIL